MKVLIVEDNVSLNEVLKKRLKSHNYIVDTAFSGDEALNYLEVDKYDIVISDIMMPNMDGYTMLKCIRNKNIDVPVLFLSAKDKSQDIVNGLNLGADDYMVKPFDFNELLARIKALTRRHDGVRDSVYTVSNLTINSQNRVVKRGEKEIKLSFKEFELLLLLVKNKNVILTREQISSALYEWEDGLESNAIDVYIRYLRKKIDDDFDEKLIETVRGVGYIIKS